LKEAFEMTDMVRKFELGTKTLEQGAKVRGFNKVEALNVAEIFKSQFGLTFGGNEN
jgi:hypothetical protein